MTIETEYLTIKGEAMVLLGRADFEDLLRKADLWEPALPQPNQRGNYPLEALPILVARDIIRARRRLGLTQAALARSAGISPETLNRIENGKRKPNVATIDKIDKALQREERKARKST